MATISRSTSPTRVGALLIAIVAVFGIGVFSVAQATLPGDGTFQLDGDWAAGAGTDWQNADQVITYTDGTGANDDIFWTGGSKDTRPIGDWRWKTGPTPSQKTDLLGVAVRTKIVDGELYAWFAAGRASANGNAKIGFWILKDAVSAVSGGAFSGEHTIGDMLIDVDWTTGGIRNNGIKAYYWDGNSMNGPKRLTAREVSSGSFGDCKTVTRSAADLRACATVNTGSTVSPWGSLPAGQFIEGAVNLTQLFGITALGCGPTILAETRSSGSSVVSELEDFVGASLSNCSITIRKSATDDTSVNFDFTSGGGVTPTSFDLKSGEFEALGNIDNSTYTIRETAKAGWTLTSIACTKTDTVGVDTTGDFLTVDFSNNKIGRVDCTFVNRKLPTITVIKDVVPDSTTAQFALKIDASTYTTTATDGTTVGPVITTTGVHTVSETDGSGVADLSTYTTSIGCRKGDAADYTTVTGLRGAERSISLGNLAYDDEVTCRITNTEVSTISVTKYLYPTTDAGRFNLTIVDASTVSGVGHLGTTGAVEVSAGVRIVRETTSGATVASDYISSIACTNGTDVTTASGTQIQFSVTTGEQWSCAVTNSKKPKIILEKQSNGSAGSFTFDVSSGTPWAYLDRTTLTTTLVSGDTYRATKTYTFDTTGGSYRFNEVNIPAGFLLTDASCATEVTGMTGVTYSGDTATGVATVENLTAGTVARCTFVNDGRYATRTQGFWSTHQELANAVWTADSSTDTASWLPAATRYKNFNQNLLRWFTPITSGDGITTAGRDFCGETVTSGTDWLDLTIKPTGGPKDWFHGDNALLGGFWAPIAGTTGMSNSRMQLLQQLLAAMLNHAFFGSAPTGTISIVDAQNAFCGGTATDIERAAAAMAAFNESGDNAGQTPGGAANPRLAKFLADVDFWVDYPMYSTLSLDLTAATGVDHTGGSIAWCVYDCRQGPVTFTTTRYTNSSVRVGPAGVKIVMNDVTNGSTSYSSADVSLTGSANGGCTGPDYDGVAGTSTFICTVDAISPSSSRGTMTVRIHL